MEGEVTEYAFVELLDELDDEGPGVRGVLEEGKYVLLVALVLAQVIVGQRAQVGALVGMVEPDLPGWRKRLQIFVRQAGRCRGSSVGPKRHYCHRIVQLEPEGRNMPCVWIFDGDVGFSLFVKEGWEMIAMCIRQSHRNII